MILGGLALGCGLLVERVSGLPLPGALIAPTGLALITVGANFTTATDLTAQLTVPLVVALAVAGFFLRGRAVRLNAWALASAVAAFAVYSAPIVLSGRATFAGYITLDDTSTWLALTDRAMDHGRSLSGLAPSTYEVVLHDYLDGGYPLGAFLPLGIGGRLTGQDIAWLFQPAIAFFGAMLALSIYAASAGLIRSRSLRALVAFVGCQPALLFAYSLWSGIKEMAAAAMLALVCVLVTATMPRWSNVRSFFPVSMAIAGLLAVLGLAGGFWLVTPAVIVAALLARKSLGQAARAAMVVGVLVAALALPSIVIARAFISRAAGADITASSGVANLGHALDDLQIFGIWPTADFRLHPDNTKAAYILISAVACAAVIALLVARRRRLCAFPLYLATSVLGVVLIFALEHVGLSSPWLNAKALATASPAIVAVGAAGAAIVFESARRVEAVVVAAAIAGGVLWSNALAYSGAWLAPRAQLAELAQIGRHFAGQGPTLMTDPGPYGVRHFLRNMEPEGASERRSRPVYLVSGRVLDKGQYADLDAFALASVLVYRTIVHSRSPVESRPPSVYRLVSQGRFWEVWRRDDAAPRILARLPLGTDSDPSAPAPCAKVLRLAERSASAGGRLATVIRPSPLVVDLAQASHPPAWVPVSYQPGSIVPRGSGSEFVDLDIPRGGRYTVWLGGSFRKRVTVFIDGREAGSAVGTLDPSSGYFALGEVDLTRAHHRIELRYGGSELRPGSGGEPFAMGPLTLSTTSADLPIRYVDPAQAHSLCGKNLDWIEAVQG